MRRHKRILRSLEEATESLPSEQKLNAASLVRAFRQVEAGGEPVSLWDQDGRLIIIDQAYLQNATSRADQALMEQLGSISEGHNMEPAP